MASLTALDSYVIFHTHAFEKLYIFLCKQYFLTGLFSLAGHPGLHGWDQCAKVRLSIPTIKAEP